MTGLRSFRRISEEKLVNLWGQLPQAANGYLITLKTLKWHECKPGALPEGTHEGRFFEDGQDLHWRRVQYFDGEAHVHGYDVVCIGMDFMDGKGIEAEPIVERVNLPDLKLWQTPLVGDLKNKCVQTKVWSRDGVPVFHQWLKLKHDKKEGLHER